MQYWKTTDENGFLSISTLDKKGNGNITLSEYTALKEMFRDALENMGIIENGSGYEYAPYPTDPDPELDDSAALEILLGGDGV